MFRNAECVFKTRGCYRRNFVGVIDENLLAAISGDERESDCQELIVLPIIEPCCDICPPDKSHPGICLGGQLSPWTTVPLGQLSPWTTVSLEHCPNRSTVPPGQLSPRQSLKLLRKFGQCSDIGANGQFAPNITQILGLWFILVIVEVNASSPKLPHHRPEELPPLVQKENSVNSEHPKGSFKLI